MYNWSVDTKRMQKEDPAGFQIWRLEQLINYGLGGEKIDGKLLKKLWNKISIQDPYRRAFLETILWEKKS